MTLGKTNHCIKFTQKWFFFEAVDKEMFDMYISSNIVLYVICGTMMGSILGTIIHNCFVVMCLTTRDKVNLQVFYARNEYFCFTPP